MNVAANFVLRPRISMWHNWRIISDKSIYLILLLILLNYTSLIIDKFNKGRCRINLARAPTMRVLVDMYYNALSIPEDWAWSRYAVQYRRPHGSGVAA